MASTPDTMNTGHGQQTTAGPSQPSQNLARPTHDDAEWWYTEPTASNRMVLSLRSGIISEVQWALERLIATHQSDNFSLNRLPGLTDALFEWPMWFIREGHLYASRPTSALFAIPAEIKSKQRFALDSLYIIRNCALKEESLAELSRHSSTLIFVGAALQTLDHQKPYNAEFLVLVMDLFHAAGATHPLPPNAHNCIPSPFSIFCSSNPVNSHHVLSTSIALDAAIRYLPLFADDELLDVCVNFIYTNLSVMTTAKDFLMRNDLASVVKLLVGILLAHQPKEPTDWEDVQMGTSVPSLPLIWPNHELSAEEFSALMELGEPIRCLEWIKAMFEPRDGGEVTQVELWTLYRETFEPEATQNQASSGRKTILEQNVFSASGIEINAAPLHPASASALYDHIQDHLSTLQGPDQYPCLWASCPIAHPVRVQSITTCANEKFPMRDPTKRPIPPPEAVMRHPKEQPTNEPSVTSLTALLCIRILYRACFTVSDVPTLPKADMDRFGFPISIGDDEEDSDQPRMTMGGASLEEEALARNRGKDAFLKCGA
ncbi:hypothetical protein DL96DRAFT_1702489 [Flagelloscypha sp. PMI_526]|nr:hypothetical protein DL96DRAFT_1702489 [Flagelloscypha sp. PMI_526]